MNNFAMGYLAVNQNRNNNFDVSFNKEVVDDARAFVREMTNTVDIKIIEVEKKKIEKKKETKATRK